MTATRLPTRRELVFLGCVGLTGCLARVERAEEKLTGKWEDKKEVLRTYQAGIDSYNHGISTIERSVGYDDWSKQAEVAEGSPDPLRRAIEAFGAAASLAEGIDERDAARVCEHAKAQAELVLRAARSLIAASRAYANGNSTRGDEQLETYERYRNEARESEIRSPRELRQVLDLQ